MELKEQVVSLELSNRLKELNCKQESLHWWYKIPKLSKDYYLGSEKTAELYWENISAFTTSELGEMLPYRLRLEDADYWLYQSKGKEHWDIRYCRFLEGRRQPLGMMNKGIFQGDTEANARASMLCYLIENKLLPPKYLKSLK